MLDTAFRAIGCMLKSNSKANVRKPCQQPDAWEILRFYNVINH